MINSKTTSTHPTLIAPCGINCRLCRAYARDRNPCPGCRGENTNKSNSCITCQIKNCEQMILGKFEYCFECAQFPCPRLAHLELRYRTRYATSPLDNLLSIRKIGIGNFVRIENKKWACPDCGAMLCMHEPKCPSCGVEWRK